MMVPSAGLWRAGKAVDVVSQCAISSRTRMRQKRSGWEEHTPPSARKMHTQLMQLRNNADPLWVPLVDEGGLLIGHDLGNLGDILDQL